MPSLGRLRELAGKDRYESGVSDTIRRMVQSGELPTRGTCAVSRKPTNDVMKLEILVPRFSKSNEPRDEWMVLLLGFWAFLYVALFRRQQFHKEGATIVQAPLCVAHRCRTKVERMGQARLKRLIRTVPIYAQLLDENPDSVVGVSDAFLQP